MKHKIIALLLFLMVPSVVIADYGVGNSAYDCLSCDITAITAEVNQLNIDTATIQAQVTVNTNEITQLNIDTATIQNQVTNNANEISQLNIDTATIQSQVTANTNEITQINIDTQTIQTQLNTLALSVATDTETISMSYSGALEISSLTATGTGVFAYIGSTINITGIRAFVTTFSATKIELDFHLVTDSTTHTTIFSTQGNRPTIAAGLNEGAEAVPDTTAIPKDSRLALHIDNTDGVAKDLMIWIKYWKVRGQ